MWEQGTGWIPDPPDQRDYGRAPTYLPASFARSGLQEQIVAPAALPPRVRASLTSDWWALVRADYLDLAAFGAAAAAQRDTS